MHNLNTSNSTTIKLTGGAKLPQTPPKFGWGGKPPQTPPDGKKNFGGRGEIEQDFGENFGFGRKFWLWFYVYAPGHTRGGVCGGFPPPVKFD